MEDHFRKFAHRTAAIVTSAWSFVTGLVVIIAWAVTGPLFKFSGDWQFAMTSCTTIVTFLLVLLLQYTEKRQMITIQLKLDELIRAQKEARTGLVHLEELSDEELDRLGSEFQRLRERETSKLERKG